MGINAIYDPTPRSFETTVSWADLERDGEDNRELYPMPLTADMARKAGWYIRWTGIHP